MFHMLITDITLHQKFFDGVENLLNDNDLDYTSSQTESAFDLLQTLGY